MRVALLSDIHANLPALDAALERAQTEGFEAVWCMGDIVGYGAQPNDVIERLQEFDARCVLGNHDAAAIGRIGTETFNPVAAEAAKWTAEALNASSREFLESLPETQTEAGWSLVHGSFRDPLVEYLMAPEAVALHLEVAPTRRTVVGHTHLPAVFWRAGGGNVRGLVPRTGETVALDHPQLCVNPGGVGQPRDGNPTAPFAILDTEALEVTFYRVGYDIAEAGRRIIEAGLPDILAARLEVGR